jgi:hypothetical protein
MKGVLEKNGANSSSRLPSMFIPDEKPIILFRIIQLGVKTADFKILNFFLAETQKYHLQSWLDIHKTSYDQS